MKIYDNEQKLVKIICNGCSCECESENSVFKKEFLSVQKSWGYFSERDGETDCWDLCEECYNRLVSSFKIKIDVSENTELMF